MSNLKDNENTVSGGAGLHIVAVDDEPLALELLVRTVHDVCPQAQIMAFTDGKSLLAYAREKTVDVAFLDIQMRGISGVELADTLRQLHPAVNLIFVTGYDQYTGDAMALHASGYILKPVNREKVVKELSDLRHPKIPAILRVCCFGNFDVFGPNGQPLHFARSKSKEAFAYLVYRRGAGCTVRELATVLFEDQPYDSKKCQYMQKILSSMMDALRSAGAESVIVKRYNNLAINIDRLDCDYYHLLDSSLELSREYRGEFMAQYSWAEEEKAALDALVLCKY